LRNGSFERQRLCPKKRTIDPGRVGLVYKAGLKNLRNGTLNSSGPELFPSQRLEIKFGKRD
jgi:hypothetical protein